MQGFVSSGQVDSRPGFVAVLKRVRSIVMDFSHSQHSGQLGGQNTFTVVDVAIRLTTSNPRVKVDGGELRCDTATSSNM